MATVSPIVSKADVDDAWSDYQSHVQRALESPPLLADRAFMEEWARLRLRFELLAGVER